MVTINLTTAHIFPCRVRTFSFIEFEVGWVPMNLETPLPGVVWSPAEITKQSRPVGTKTSSKHVGVIQISIVVCMLLRRILVGSEAFHSCTVVRWSKNREVKSKAVWLWGFTSLCYSSWDSMAKAWAMLGKAFIMRIYKSHLTPLESVLVFYPSHPWPILFFPKVHRQLH